MNLFDLPHGTEEDESVLELRAVDRISKHDPIQTWLRIGSFSLHRIRGPAVIYKDGTELWWRDGQYYSPTAHELVLWELRKKNESV